MLKSITTTNFKKLDNHHFEFTSGLNILCGDNMAGKTTLTQAVMFCLFGVRALPCAADGIPTWGETDCSVALEVGDYVITRSIKNCKVYEGKKLVATGNSPCSRYIEEHITGIDLKGFKILNWSEAGETSALLTIGATQLQRDVEKFSGVAFIDEIIKLAGVDLRDVERAVGLFESKGSVADLEEAVGQLAGKATTGEAVLKAHEGAIPEIEGLLEKTKEEFELAQKNNRKAVGTDKSIAIGETNLQRYDEQIAEHTEGLKEASTELGSFDEVSDSYIASEKEAIKAARTVNREVNSTCDKLNETNDLLDSAPSGILDDQRLVDEIEMTNKELNAAEKDEVTKGEKVAALKSEIRKLNSAISEGTCYACGQSIASEEQTAKYQKELATAEASIDNLIKLHTASLDKLSEANNNLSLAKQNKKTFYGDWESHNRQWEQVVISCEALLLTMEATNESKLTIRETALEALVIQSSKVDDLKRLVRKHERKLQEYNTHKEATFIDLRELKDNRPIVTSDVEMDRLSNDMQGLENDIKNTITTVGSIKLKLSKLHTDLAEAKDNLKQELKFQDINKEVKLLKELIAYLKTSRTAFLSSVWAQILGAASGFLAQATDNVITALSKSDKDGFMFCENGIYAPVSAASGAQRGFLGVGIRLALAQSLRSSCPIVVLDEPTEAMREENALRLSGALLGHGQILMVTHRESDKVAAANVIEL